MLKEGALDPQDTGPVGEGRTQSQQGGLRTLRASDRTGSLEHPVLTFPDHRAPCQGGGQLCDFLVMPSGGHACVVQCWGLGHGAAALCLESLGHEPALALSPQA